MNSTITDIKIYEAQSPLSKPIADSTHNIDQIAFYVVELTTLNGIRGQGYLLSFDYSKNAIKGALMDIRDYLRNHSYKTYETLKLREEYNKELEYFGQEGLQSWALAIVDVAMWDAWGKELKQPIYKILGGYNKPVPVYGSGGWLSYSEEELINETRDYVKRGFKSVKIKVGSQDLERDIARIKMVREKVGKDIRIMMDGNQGMNVSDAIMLSKAVEDVNVTWFEEPISNKDFDGYQMIHQNTSISLAMGEREYNLFALQELIKRQAIDLWQPDLIRIGGVEEWRKSAILANINNIPVLPHYYKDYDVPLLTTVQNIYGSESFDWIDGIIDNPMEIIDGYAVLRQEPGWGFEFKKEYLKEVKE